jgi:hypothetical protein
MLTETTEPPPLILFPCHGQATHATNELIHVLRSPPYNFDILWTFGHSAIDAVRSVLATRALLAGPYKWWLWLDADISLTPQNAVRLIESAKQHDADMMAASYVTKSKDARHTVVWPDDKEHVYGLDGEVYPMQHCGFGATVTHRRLFERLAAVMPPVKFMGDKFIGRAFFMPMISPSNCYLSEDYAFCRRARQLDPPARMFCNTRIRVGHIGPYEYSWEDAMGPPLEPLQLIRLTVQHTSDTTDFGVI